ncbi:hypothetical protein [Streptomyces sp. NPDC048650]|uniref:hypothetical protein n=1 Tax=Streptomyces sp. NPDC048650 TaxID=3365583 RepID=UPI00371A1091
MPVITWRERVAESRRAAGFQSAATPSEDRLAVGPPARPAAELLDGEQWAAVAEDVLLRLRPDEPVEEQLAMWVRALDAA